MRIVALHSYNIVRDEWKCAVCWNADLGWVFRDIGVWRERVFAVRMKPQVGSAIALELMGSVPEWPVSDLSAEHWTVVDRMPEGLRFWILAGRKRSWKSTTRHTRCRVCSAVRLCWKR